MVSHKIKVIVSAKRIVISTDANSFFVCLSPAGSFACFTGRMLRRKTS